MFTSPPERGDLLELGEREGGEKKVLRGWGDEDVCVEIELVGQSSDHFSRDWPYFNSNLFFLSPLLEPPIHMHESFAHSLKKLFQKCCDNR